MTGGGMTGGGGVRSSLMIVPTTGDVVPMVYPVPAASERAMVSLGSTPVSAVGFPETVAVAEPVLKVMVLPVPGVAPV